MKQQDSFTITEYFWRSFIYVIGFWALWQFGGLFSVVPAQQTVSAFYPVPGLTLAFIALFGWKYIPAILIGNMLAMIPDKFPWDVSFFVWAQGGRQMIVYGIAGIILGKIIKSGKGLDSRQGVLLFILVAIGSGLISAAFAYVNFSLFWSLPNEVLIQIFGSFWTGDVVGMLMVAPLLLILCRHWQMGTIVSAFKTLLRNERQAIALSLIIPVLVSGSAFAYIAFNSSFAIYGYLILIPIAWLAASYGTGFGSFAALVGNMVAAGVYSYFAGTAYSATEIQILFTIASTIGLIIGASRDDFLRAERKIHARENELANLSKLASIGELGTTIVHEIATPLQIASSNSQLAIKRLKQNEGNSYKEILEYQLDVQSAIDRAAEIQNHIRRFIIGNIEADLEAVDVTKSIQEACRLLDVGSWALKPQLDISSSTPAIVMADPIGLRQVFVNLLKNAKEANDGSGQSSNVIYVKLQNQDRIITISVEDNGGGFGDDELANGFNGLFTTKKNGLGMGLSICRTTVEGFGGNIHAENTSQGAKLIVTLPEMKMVS